MFNAAQLVKRISFNAAVPAFVCTLMAWPETIDMINVFRLSQPLLCLCLANGHPLAPLAPSCIACPPARFASYANE